MATRQLDNNGVPREFRPSLTHPFYFIRQGLYKGILSKSGALKGRLLDFGCGSKPYRSLFDVEEYIGVDYYNEGHPHDNEQIDFFYDGKKLPFCDQNFDSVLCSEVFEHVFNLDEALAEINRVLKTDGRILITCPFVWNEHEVPHDYARYTRFALEDILKRAGFEIMEFSKSGNFILVIHQEWVLYFKLLLQKKSRKFFLFRWLYKVFFVFLPNLTGSVLNALLPENDSLYLNNIVLARKVRQKQ
ncbi:MAG: methyltransferase domain-containing protein [Chitinophagaceae bacterium]|nr:methyltransferase domain-containing protein [Chitinophagaceae bacterium]